MLALSLSRKQFLVSLVALAGAALVSGSSNADEMRFAVTAVNNRTPDVVINFEYRWGETGEWKKIKGLKPGRTEVLWHELDVQGKAPRLQVRINEAIGSNHDIEKIFDMKWNAAPTKDVKFGYPFSIKRDTMNDKYVSVYDDMIKPV